MTCRAWCASNGVLCGDDIAFGFSAWFQSLPLCQMASFGMLAGASDRREGVAKGGLVTIVGMLWLTYYSQLPLAYSAVCRGVFSVDTLRWLGLHPPRSDRFLQPTWFLLALIIWRSINLVCTWLHVPCLAAMLSVVAHFGCAGGRCAFPFQREPVYNDRLQHHVGFPHVQPPGQLASAWLFYAAVPYLLPTKWPLDLLGQAKLERWLRVHGRTSSAAAASVRIIRIFWRMVGLATLLCHSIAGAPTTRMLVHASRVPCPDSICTALHSL